MYGHGEDQSMEVAETCATDNKFDWDNIKTCTEGDMGRK